MSTTAETSPANSVQIREATYEDADAVFALVERLGIGRPPQRASFDAAFADAVKVSEEHILLVADIAGIVIGYALTTITRPLYTFGAAAQLQELVVDSSVAGRGFGSLLVTAVEHECRDRGVHQLTVASIRAAAFYERMDYRSTADYLKKSFLDD
ncbi:MAG: family N-acetyltransferase [Microbacteriaceae bacterium]|nr:family N-acetyltransferase [Microbacteriaceae bacterium]